MKTCLSLKVTKKKTQSLREARKVSHKQNHQMIHRNKVNNYYSLKYIIMNLKRIKVRTWKMILWKNLFNSQLFKAMNKNLIIFKKIKVKCISIKELCNLKTI